MINEFAQKCQKLRPNQITDISVDPLNLTQLYELIKVALDNDCYTVFAQPRLHARKLQPVDETGYPGLTFAVPTYGTLAAFDETIKKSPTILDPRNELFTLHNRTSPADVFELAHQHGTKEWIVFTHHDVYLPKNWGSRFWRAITDAERQFGPIGVAGVFGVSGDRRVRRIEAGAVLDQNGTRTLVGQVPLPAVVRTLDGCVLAVRRGSGLIPDPQLGWHFYDADVCLQAAEKGLKNVAVESWVLHRSAWSSPDDRFRASEELFKQKWTRALPVEVPCALVS